jgi:hypothetical protein
LRELLTPSKNKAKARQPISSEVFQTAIPFPVLFRLPGHLID